MNGNAVLRQLFLTYNQLKFAVSEAACYCSKEGKTRGHSSTVLVESFSEL